jgi:hypothetical protein
MRTRLILLAIGACVFSGPALFAQTSDSRTDTTDPGTSNINPTRTVQSHTESGNRTLDTQSTQVRGSSGNFEPYQDIEKETVKVDAATVRTTTRTFGRDADGARKLLQVTEEEQRNSSAGDSRVVRSTSNPDADGRLQLVQRQIEETKKISKDVAETKTTVMLPSSSGGLAPAMQVQERSRQGADGTIESQKTTLLPDGNGNWQVGEVQRSTIQKQGQTTTTSESISRPDLDGNLGGVSRTVSTETESAPGESQKTVEIYSADVPGAARDGSLHSVERTTTKVATGSTGRQTTERQVERTDPSDPLSGLRVTTVTVDMTNPTSSGARSTRTIRAGDANGNLGVVSVDTTDTRGSSAVQVQIAPTEKSK